MGRAFVLMIFVLAAVAGCKGKCEKLEQHMFDIGLGHADAERERKACNRGEYSDEYIECAMKAQGRGRPG